MCNKAEMQFSVYIIYQLSLIWGKNPSEVFQILNQTKILDEYIIAHYDVLHTQGSYALVDDISDFVREKGIKI